MQQQAKDTLAHTEVNKLSQMNFYEFISFFNDKAKGVFGRSFQRPGESHFGIRGPWTGGCYCAHTATGEPRDHVP